MANKKSIYAKTLAVPGKKIAGTNPVGAQTAVGGLTPPMVPAKSAVLHGLGPVTKPIREPQVKGSHGFGHVAKLKQGHLRMSGNPAAHRVGAGMFKSEKPFK